MRLLPNETKQCKHFTTYNVAKSASKMSSMIVGNVLLSIVARIAPGMPKMMLPAAAETLSERRLFF